MKKVIKDKEVVIIPNRHPSLLRSVPKIYGVDNHAYCYLHLKENFSSFYSKQNKNGSKGKKNTLQWLDKIVYARVNIEYNDHMHELRKFNDVFATWIEQNELEH